MYFLEDLTKTSMFKTLLKAATTKYHVVIN